MNAGMTADTDADGRWLTYAELADIRGIDRQSARRLVSRQKWRRQKDNQNIVRVYVPTQGAAPLRPKQDMSADMTAVMTTDMSRIASAFEAAIGALTARAEAAETRADLATARAEAAHIEAAALRAQLADPRGTPGPAPDDRPAVASRIDEVQLRRLQEADQARKALRRLARLRLAWRGE
jgi:hypothetical protein